MIQKEAKYTFFSNAHATFSNIEHINFVTIYDPNTGAHKYIKKILEDFKKDIDSNTIIVGNFNTPLSKMITSCKQNINKDIVTMNNALEKWT